MVRDKKRIKRILNLIEELWMLNPDGRFGQTLINYNIVPDDIRVWSNEDDKFEDYLKKLLKGLKVREKKNNKIKHGKL